MILSMTGFAAVAADLPGVSLAVELRSVNHRYLDLQLRLPDELRGLESALRERIAAELKRGKVECRVYAQPDRGRHAVAGGRHRARRAARRGRGRRPRPRARRDAAVDRGDPALARRAGRALGAARGARGARPRARRPARSPTSPPRAGAKARRPRRCWTRAAPASRRRSPGSRRGFPRCTPPSSTSSAPGCAKPGSIPTRTG